MEALMPMLIQAVAGAAGGGVLGQFMKTKSIGLIGNLLAGAIGGVATGQGLGAAGVLAQLAPMMGGNAVLVSAVTSLLGGGVLQAIAAQVMGKKAA